MTFEFSPNTLDNISAGGIAVFAFEDKEQPVLTNALMELDKVLNGIIEDDIKVEVFKGKIGSAFAIHTHRKILSPKIFVVGLGKRSEFNAGQLRKAMTIFSKGQKGKISSIALVLLDAKEADFDTTIQSQMIAEGLLLGSYSFVKYKEKEEKEFEMVIFSENNKNTQVKTREGIKKAEIFYEATKVARDLVNEPSAVVNPTFLADLATDIAKKNREIKCTVYEKDEIRKMGMGAFLGIAQAADTPPKFIFLEYSPRGLVNKQKLAIVGKGITFDTGGISLKPESSMATMKCDMAGAAAVLGVVSVISQIKPKMSVMGIIAATPNMVSGKSLVPGDVVRAMNGKTIEVLNTDAEGRVTLADSLSYAVEKGATEIIDLATLTGAAEVALGTEISAMFGNNDSLKVKVKKAGDEAGEKLWELPLEKEYKDLNKSDVADISNIPSTRMGGAITAALFLEEFVDKKPWVHLDIAGPSFAERTTSINSKGGTGFGVRTLLNFLLAD